MSNTILITGGSPSGKTRWAATKFAAFDYVLYLRTAEAVDADTLKRIEYDNNRYGVEWDIVTDVLKNPKEHITDHKFVIFDDLSAYTMAVIKQMCSDPSAISADDRKEIEKRIIGDITEMYDHIKEIEGSLIVITLETGFSTATNDTALDVFREILGNVNQRIANMSDEVYFSASGIQFKIK